MSGVARINKRLPVPEKYESPTTVHVNLKKHSSLKDIQVGKKVAFSGSGVVRSLHADEMGHTASIDVDAIKQTGKEETDEEE